MGKLKVFLLFPCLLSCSANPIGMFDFNNRNSSQLGSQFTNSNSTITDVAAAIFKGDIKETFPEKVTICNTIYADLDDLEIRLDGSDWYLERAYPTWAFVNDNGKANLSLLVESSSLKTEALRLWIRGVKVGYQERVELGRLQLSIS